ncbi:hypothetical protein SPRG_04086 [Saprolegnia parasitica CBS 223.65]|uniref:Acyl-coenzyme A thioesterase THEM4 n=1 Tax=Saprolegnia parasitica (strain CBS 223.65) TaxID=695850 RepID=A0A067CY52_SAPPC|nr:hypothetical protein SPRG_04086 [Saprolegnia parasitica CBS 223.65]KDO31471.1 hypothetical protein SPRG_04086 [Saprolegnia parasitica CBS 223.65]|eukprot:XP_012198064.1 hypothetical protein SPRG_04086 [Saprolegnia parasitica CBS 223.65]
MEPTAPPSPLAKRQRLNDAARGELTPVKPSMPSKYEAITNDASFQDISTDVLVDSNVFDVTKHYIHSLSDIQGKYEEFMVYGDVAKTQTISLVHFGEKLCGHTGIVHGGCISTVCDELFGWTMYWITGNVGFTAYLNVNFRKPLPTQTSGIIYTELDRREGRKVFMKARVEDNDGTLYTEASALFILPRPTEA